MIAIVVASEGKNADLAEKVFEEAKSQGSEARLINLLDFSLPLYSTREEKANGIPKKAVELKELFQKAKSFVFVAPEYNGSVPPTLNNSIAWVSRAAEDWREAFNGKVASIATHSGGGGAHVLMSMRMQLSYVGMTVLGRQILTTYQKELNQESLKEIISQQINLTK